MRKNVHRLDMTRLAEAAAARRNVRVLGGRAAQQARSEADLEGLMLLLCVLSVVTSILLVWSWLAGWWE